MFKIAKEVSIGIDVIPAGLHNHVRTLIFVVRLSGSDSDKRLSANMEVSRFFVSKFISSHHIECQTNNPNKNPAALVW